MEAVYILEPTIYNIECIAADYTKAPARYAGANIFFTSGLDSHLERKVRNSSIARHLRSLDQICIDFWPLESHTFSFKDPYALEKFYNDDCSDILMKALHKMALQLVSVCATLDEYPIIRFYEADKTERLSRKLPYLLAKEFQQELDKYARDHADFPDTSENRPRSVFLLLDRAVDWIAPLLHEFTYQATTYDLLPMRDWREFKYTENIMGKDQVQVGQVSDKDPEWVSLRHTHIGLAGEKLGYQLADLKKKNPHLADATKEVKVNDLKDMMLNLPMFNEQRARYVFHVAMASECMSQVEKRNLIELAEVEQVCATRMQDEKTKAKGLAETVIVTLADERLDPKDKVRLILLYGIYRGGLVEADYIKLLRHCNLPDDELTPMYNYIKLGAPVYKNLAAERVTKHDIPTRFDSQHGGDSMPSSRYVPAVYNIVDLLIHGKLPAALFPYIKDQPTEDDEGMDYNTGSLRNQRQKPTWANPTNARAVRQRVFVFMAGGMTASETRSCYEISNTNSLNKEIIIGGTDFIAPNQFLNTLKRLSVPRSKLGLKEDQVVETKAPKHLYESEREVQKAKEAAAAAAAAAAKPVASVHTPINMTGSGGKNKKATAAAAAQQQNPAGAVKPVGKPVEKEKEKKKKGLKKFFK